MTKKQIQELTIRAQSAFAVGDEYGVERYKEICEFLRMARDLGLIDNKKLDKYRKEIGDAAMEAMTEYRARRTA